MKGISLFSSSGIGEYYFSNIGIDIVAANELIPKRANLYSYFYPQTNMITGDISDSKIKNQIKSFLTDDIKLLIATPPCQGLSSLGKNKVQSHFEVDKRNFLIFEVFDIIDYHNFDYIVIENVPKFLDMYFPYENRYRKLVEILKRKYSKQYVIESKVLNAKDYGVPQTRPRAVIKMFKHSSKWPWPRKQKEITLMDSIGHLPSIEPGETTPLKYHYGKKINGRIIKALHHTPPGRSALTNAVHYPKKADGSRIKGFHNTYKRMVWDQPAHARTTFNGSVSSHNNVHPGRLNPDGTYSDCRVLSLLETFIVSSLPEDVRIPDWASESFIRTVIGESVPPAFLKEILKGIKR